jgi:Tfp pilus assembly protein FimT
MFRFTGMQSRGISVLEILIALGVLGVIFSFASTSFSHASTRAELQATVEEVKFSIQGARSTARELETDVVMHLQASQHETQNSISFALPNRNAELGSSNLLQDYLIPADVRLVTYESDVHFDSRGLVAAPVELKLVSSVDESLSESILIE